MSEIPVIINNNKSSMIIKYAREEKYSCSEYNAVDYLIYSYYSSHPVW